MCCRFSEPRKSDSSLLDWNRNVDKKNSGKSTKRPKKTLFMLKNWPEPKICQFDMIVLHCKERCFRLFARKDQRKTKEEAG